MSLSSYLPLIIFLVIWTATTSSTARSLDSPPSLVARLNLDESSSGPTCWDSLYQLQSCTGEVIQFFYDGQTKLGQECCQAIYVIGHNCWPAMLGSLGFTAEETALLQGYCDAEESAPSPSDDN